MGKFDQVPATINPVADVTLGWVSDKSCRKTMTKAIE
jgi:hypothetical protein